MSNSQNKLRIDSDHSSIESQLFSLADYDLYSKLDSIKPENLRKPFSEIYSGGVAAMTSENRKNNPDWMAQSANSFREILYTLQRVEDKELKKILAEYFGKNYVKDHAEKFKEYLHELYQLFTAIAHHFSEGKKPTKYEYKIAEDLTIKAEVDEKSYFEAVRLYNHYLKLLVNTAIEIHRRIDECINQNIKDKALVKIFINNSYDSKSYFYTKVGPEWLHWLWTNAFFANLIEIGLDTEGKHNVHPELEYIRRIAGFEPETVAKIIQSIPISEKNSSIIYHFIWVLDSLPVRLIKQIAAKIHNEKWISLLMPSQISGYEFKGVVNKLDPEKDAITIINLAKSILTVQSKSVFSQNETIYHHESPFTVSNILDSGILLLLSNLKDDHIEEAYIVLIDAMAQIIQLGTKSKKEIYKYSDIFGLYDIDVFTIELDGMNQGRSYRKDFLSFIATLKTLIIENFSKHTTISKLRKLYLPIDSLPASQFSRRLKLFALSQNPRYLKKEFRTEIFKIFESKNPHDNGSEAEYQKSLKKGFFILSHKDKRKYIQGMFRHFTKAMKKNPDQSWHAHTAWEISSCIMDFLTLDELAKVEKVFDRKCSKTYSPKPQIGQVRSGTVSHQSPVEIEKYSISEIIDKLGNEWSPHELKAKYKFDDFLKPRGARGLGYALTSDVKNRLEEYLLNLQYFFNKAIDFLYLNAVLMGIKEVMKSGQSLKQSQIKLIFSLLKVIAKDNEIIQTLSDQNEQSYLWGQWHETNSICIDMLQHILWQNNISKRFLTKHEDDFINILLYWFSFPDFIKSTEKESPQDLYGTAINSIRGRAYEAYIGLVHSSKNLSSGIKMLLNKALSDETLSVRFCIGRYISVFYYVNKDFTTQYLPIIFPKENIKLFIAAFSGYLSRDLYIDFFEKMETYYLYAIQMDTSHLNSDNSLYPSFDEFLATHIALAFVFAELTTENELFIRFWSFKNTERHHKFVSFIGQSSLDKEEITEEWLKKKNVSKRKLLKFWDFCLASTIDPEVLSGFGYWINPKKEILNDKMVIDKITTTIKGSNGKLDWDYGFLHRLPSFAKIDDAKTLESIKYYLLDLNGNLRVNHYRQRYYEEEIKLALSIIYQSPKEEIKQKTIDLINSLIDKGGSVYWDLKEILN